VRRRSKIFSSPNGFKIFKVPILQLGQKSGWNHAGFWIGRVKSWEQIYDNAGFKRCAVEFSKARVDKAEVQAGRQRLRAHQTSSRLGDL